MTSLRMSFLNFLIFPLHLCIIAFYLDFIYFESKSIMSRDAQFYLLIIVGFETDISCVFDYIDSPFTTWRFGD